ncbi:MAG: hypothetical protein IT315_04095 [Anaerolineales bacterium]|nr:hypothetical protein [Anaerolineales bacterium]
MKFRYLASSYLMILASLIFTLRVEQHLFPPYHLLRPLLALWVVLGVVAKILKHFLVDWEKVEGWLVAVVVLFMFPPVLFWIVVYSFAGMFIIRQLYRVLSKTDIRKVWRSSLYLVTGMLLLLYSIGLNLPEYRNVRWPVYFSALRDLKETDISLPARTDSLKPDIYYIVVDGYVRSDMLGDLYGYDNSPFVAELENMGFVVPRQSHSNYSKTALSIPSTLNMNYVDVFAPGLDNSKFWWLTEPFIDHSATISLLESQGYKTVSTATNWSLTDMDLADVHVKAYPVELTDFEQYFLQTTPLRLIQPLIQNTASVFTVETHRKTILNALNSFGEIASDPDPTFVFAHILLPHPPFVFDASGASIAPSREFSFKDAEDFEGSLEEYQQGYIGQVEFLNSRLSEMVAVILQQSKTPPIIIIQADHGSGLLAYFSSVEKTCIRERFSTFAAYYFPGLTSDEVPADLATVNLFRFVFNKYFGGDFPLLENRYYYIGDPINIYRDVDVTSRLNESCDLR